MLSVAKQIDRKIAALPPTARAALASVRATALAAAPGATERISYGLPSLYWQGKALVHYGAFRNHIGFYPPVRGLALQRAAKVYANEKGNLRFPLKEPMPLKLVTRLVKARLKELQSKR